ncbi:MAG: carbohydrate binding domain-containing protein [Candidatus Methanoperedens sp.]
MIRTKFGLALFLMIMLTGQAMAADVKISPPGYLPNPGETFDLNVTIDPQGAAIAGAQLNIGFDRTKIRINKITEGNLFKQNGAGTFFSNGIINNSTGTVINIFGVVIGRTNVSNPGTFIIINATAVGSSGTSGIYLSNAKISNSDALPVPLVVYNASMTINGPPVLSQIGDKKIFEGQTLNFTLSATDNESGPLTYSASNLPAGATFDPDTKTLRWIPDFTRSGIYPNVHFEVSDGTFTDFENITITVNKRSNIRVTPSNKIVNTGQAFSLNISIDPMGNPIAGAELSLLYDGSLLNVNNVTGGTLFNGSGTIFNGGVIDNPSGKVNNIYGSIPAYNVTNEGTFIVIDFMAIGSSGISLVNISDIMIIDLAGYPVAFNLTNGNVLINSPPVLDTIGNRSIEEGQALTFTLSATDINGDALTYSAINLPSGAVFVPANRTFLWTPDFTQSGNYPDIHFEVSDGSVIDIENVTITVNNVNRPPTFSSYPDNGSTFNETEVIPISILANDPDNDTLSYKITLDGNLVSTAANYLWITNYSSSGNHTIEITVNDGTVSVMRTTMLYIAALPVKTSINNIIKNPGFESGTTSWTFYTNGKGTFGTASGYEGNNSARLNLISSVSSPNIQLYQKGITLEPNTSYRLSFAAYSTTGHDISFSIQKHSPPYTNYGLSNYVANLGTSWSEYSVQFKTTGFSRKVNDARLMFWLSGFAAAGDSYYIDDIRLEKVSVIDRVTPTITTQPLNQTVTAGQNATFTIVATGTAPLSYQWQRNGINIPGATNAMYTIPATTLPDDGSTYRVNVTNNAGSAMSNSATLTLKTSIKNIIKNPGFESGTNSWTFYTNGKGTFGMASGYEGNNSAELNLISIVSSPNIQLYQKGITLEPNTSYRLSFAAYSTTGHDISVSIQKHGSPYTNYGLSNYVANLGTSWSEYSVQFTTSGFSGNVTDARLMFWLSGFAAAGDNYYIDDIRLEKI